MEFSGSTPRGAALKSRDPRWGTTGLLFASTCSLALGFVRVFGHWEFLPSLLVVALGVHVVSLGARLTRVSAPAGLAIQFASVYLITSWVRLHDTLWYGLPLGRTWSEISRQISDSATLVGDIKPPIDFATGFGLVACLAIGVVAALSDTFAFRAAGRGEVIVPGAVVFVVVAIVGEDRLRVPVTIAWLALSLIVVTVLRRDTHIKRVLPAIVLCFIIAVSAAVVGTRLPGANEDALLDRNDGPGRVVEPLVDVRGRLGDRSDTVLFSVKSDAPSYWRITSLSEFDGITWGIAEADLDAAGGALAVVGNEDSRFVNQTFDIVGLQGNMAPAAFEPVQLRAASRSLYYELESGTLLVGATGLSTGDSYQLVSAVHEPSPDILAAASTINPPMSGFTALPNNAEIEQLRQLAREITASATGPYQRALFLQNYFRDEFIYSLDTPSITSEDAFLEFIARRTGYCEQFASTFAVMARSIGLPARVAIGFTPGQSDGAGGYIVRSQHAHAWPEVWFDGIGWLMFEPTPGRGAPNASYTGVSPQQDDSAPESPTASTTLPPTTTPTTPTTSPNPIVTTPSSIAPSASTTNNERSTWPFIMLAILAVIIGWPLLLRMAVDRRARTSTRHPVVILWRRMIAASGVGLPATSTPTEIARRVAASDDDEVPRRLAKAVDMVLFAEREPDEMATLAADAEAWIIARQRSQPMVVRLRRFWSPREAARSRGL